MRVFHKLEEITPHLEKTAVAIGNFDGVHLGHGELLQKTRQRGQANGAQVTVLTFFPHPVEVLNPSKKLERLTTTEEKLELLENYGVDFVLVEKFDATLSSLSPSQFFERYLVEGLKAASVHVGFNFKFGKGREGNTQVLRELCQKRGMVLCVEPPFEIEATKIDSSSVRHLISLGEVDRAALWLGRPYAVRGQVQHGDHRGTGLGFPTANLHFPKEKVRPKNGVYVTRAEWQRQIFRSVTNVGVRPTFGDGAKSVSRIEVHLLEFSARLYDELLKVEFLKRIRDERKFPSIQALKAEIHADVAVALAFSPTMFIPGGDRT